MDHYQQSQKNKLFKPEHGDPYLEPTPQGTAHCPQLRRGPSPGALELAAGRAQ